MKCTIFLSLFFFVNQLSAQSLLVDARDKQEYQIVRLEQLFWMAENLRYQAKGSYCEQDCEYIRFYDFQNLEGVCPDGWRLPRMEEWKTLISAIEGVEKAWMMEGNTKLFRVDFLNQFNFFESNVLNIKPYGRVEGGSLKKGNFIDYWTTNDATDMRFHMHLTPYSVVGHSHKHHLKPNKEEEYRRFPIRCVCEAEKIEN